MPPLRFGVFDLDPETGDLWRKGRRIHLSAQPARVLALLASRPGEIVSRNELRRHVWGEGTFVDFDQGLNFCIASIRSALGDDARSPRFVETVPRRGYRFLADVRTPEGGRARAGFRNARPWAWVAALLLVLAQTPRPQRAHTRTTAVPAALASFERGQQRMSEGPSGRRASIHELREAVRLDPRFAEAYWALGDVYLRLAVERELPATSALAEAKVAALRAEALEPIAETKQLVGTVRLWNEWDWAGAERDLAAAVRIEPSWDSGLVSYAKLLSAKGDDAGAVALIDRAETVSPACDLVLFDSAMIRYRARRYDEALRKLDGALRFSSTRHTASSEWQREIQAVKVRIRARQADWPAARQEALAILTLVGVPAAQQRDFAAAPPREAIRRFYTRSADLMSADAEMGRIAPTRMALVNTALGRAEAATEWLQRAAAERDPDLLYDLRDPDFDEIRSQPAFQAVEERVRGSARPARSFLDASLVALTIWRARS